MKRVSVLMLYGGKSSEHDVSIASARNVHEVIDVNKYDIYPCYIDQTGKWWLLDSFTSEPVLDEAQELLPRLGGGRFKKMRDGEDIVIDIILPILHGKNGEDGSVQGLAQLLHIPIVGCDVTASAIGMDKVAAKEIASANNILVVPYVVHRAGEPLPDFEELRKVLGTPLFVKPSRAGSSVGVSKVHDSTSFTNAVKAAHVHDSAVLIEQAIEARELEVAVLGTPPNHQVSGVGEIVPGAEFYSYDDKYAADSQAQAKIPADISDEAARELKAMASAIYQMLGCKGLSRVDFFMDASGKMYFNEINTLPGFTDISMYPKLWDAEGVSYADLIEKLIDDALMNGTI